MRGQHNHMILMQKASSSSVLGAWADSYLACYRRLARMIRYAWRQHRYTVAKLLVVTTEQDCIWSLARSTHYSVCLTHVWDNVVATES